MCVCNVAGPSGLGTLKRPQPKGAVGRNYHRHVSGEETKAQTLAPSDVPGRDRARMQTWAPVFSMAIIIRINIQ
jgi:hypothetical protein